METLGMGVENDYQPKQNVDRFLKDRQDDKVGLLQESITDINSMISSRESLHKEILESVASMKLFVNNNMPKTDMTSEMTKAQEDLLKELLKKKIELDELKAEEKLNFWRDTANLKKELREHMKEFRDMESKTSMIDNILDM